MNLSYKNLSYMGPVSRSRVFFLAGVTEDMDALEAAVAILQYFWKFPYPKPYLSLLKSILTKFKRRIRMCDSKGLTLIAKGEPVSDLNKMTPAQIAVILTTGTATQVRQVLTQFTVMGLQSAGVSHVDAAKYIRLMYDVTRDEVLLKLDSPPALPEPPSEEPTSALAGWEPDAKQGHTAEPVPRGDNNE